MLFGDTNYFKRRTNKGPLESSQAYLFINHKYRFNPY